MNALFSRIFLVTALAASFVAPSAQAQSDQDYITIAPQPSDTPDKIEVLEFFAYTCPHCATMESLMQVWEQKAPQDVVVKRVPIAFNASMEPLQRLYFTLEALNLTASTNRSTTLGPLNRTDDLHPKVFAAIHDQRQSLFTKPAITDWAVKQGIDKAQFEKAFDSFSVNSQVQRANQLTTAYRIEGTPALAVGGKFVTSPVMAGNSYAGAIEQLDKLIPMARQK